MCAHPLSHITNFLPISESIGSSGQPTAEQFALIAEAGYQVVINLALPTSSNAIANEGELVTRMGMIYVHIPVVWEQPKLEDFDCFQRIVGAFEGKKIYVHCALNMRVSCFFFLYRVLNQKTDIRAAQDDLAAIWQPDEVWQKFIDDVLDKFKPQPGAEK